MIDPLSPGPGYYTLNSDLKPLRQPTKSFGKDERFSYVERALKKQTNPTILGPDMNSRTFVKKTFNITTEDRIN